MNDKAIMNLKNHVFNLKDKIAMMEFYLTNLKADAMEIDEFLVDIQEEMELDKWYRKCTNRLEIN